MNCEHIPKKIQLIKQNEVIRKCSCGQPCEYICVSCHCGLCEICRDTHQHPVSITKTHGYCKECHKQLELNCFSKEYIQLLPPFLPWNAKGLGLYFKHHLPKNMIILAGAGISTTAGIPDFRTPGTGLYDNLEQYNLPTPESIFTLVYFDKNPQPFFTLSKELMPGLGKYFPTVTHYFIRFLIDKGIVLKYLTQNIDGLEVQAGIPMNKLVLAHGHFYTGHCRKCKKKYKQKDFFDDIQEGSICYCKCGGVIKPDIVFFGEQLPQEFHKSLNLFNKCDFLLVMGTSLQVQPFSGLIQKVKQNTPRAFLNLSDVSEFGKRNDIKVLQKTDDAVFEIVDYWGVGDEFRKFLDKMRVKEQKQAFGKK